MKGSTLIALAVLVVIGLSALVASNFLKQKFTFLPRAQQSTAWSWDEAANQCPDKGSDLAPCICRQLQSEGICAPVGSINENGLVCVANKWDNSWGCWGSPDQASEPGAQDSTSVSGDSCSLTPSQYGACPDWASENSCHQRLDPPGDPDYGLWFKCVNRWWNGPCDTQEACDGIAALPAEDTSTTVDTSTSVDISSSNTATYTSGECIRMGSATNCNDVCKKGRPDTDPNQEWFCSADGINPTPGQYCCPMNIDLTPTPGVGQLGGACNNYYWACDPSLHLKCVNSICVEDTSNLTPGATRTPTPSPTAGPSPVPGSSPTPNPTFATPPANSTCTNYGASPIEPNIKCPDTRTENCLSSGYPGIRYVNVGCGVGNDSCKYSCKRVEDLNTGNYLGICTSYNTCIAPETGGTSVVSVTVKSNLINCSGKPFEIKGIIVKQTDTTNTISVRNSSYIPARTRNVQETYPLIEVNRIPVRDITYDALVYFFYNGSEHVVYAKESVLVNSLLSENITLQVDLTCN